MTRESRLARILVAMADTLVEDYDVLEFLYALSESCVELLEATACGVLLMDAPGELELAAATSLDMRTLQVFQGTARQGPCFDAYARGESVVERDIRACRGRWPEFVPRAAECGCVAVLAQPLRLRGETIGALNAFRDRAVPFGEDELTLSRGLADMAAVGILNARAYATSQDQVRGLQHALEGGATVEQAKAMLAERLDLSLDDAFHLLRRHARNRNRKLRDVAHRFMDGRVPLDELLDPDA